MSVETRVLYNETCPVCRFEIGHYRKAARAEDLPIGFDDLTQTSAWGVAPKAPISVNDLRAVVLNRDFDATDAALIAAHTEYTAAQPQSFAFLARGSSAFEM